MAKNVQNLNPEDPVSQLRSFFLESVESEGAISEAELYLETLENREEPIIRAYEAMFSIMRAKYVFWPGRKMEYLNKGLPVLDELIEKDPDHLEVRYLRLLGCYYLPRILKRGWSVDEDFQSLAQLLPEQRGDYPPALYLDMVRFVYERGKVNEPQKDKLRILLADMDQQATNRKTVSARP